MILLPSNVRVVSHLYSYTVVDGSFTYQLSPCGNAARTPCGGDNVGACQSWSAGRKLLGQSSMRNVTAHSGHYTIHLGGGAPSTVCNGDNRVVIDVYCNKAAPVPKIVFGSLSSCVYHFMAVANVECM